MDKSQSAASAAGAAEARALAEKLSARSDALNEAIGRAEEHLGKLRYGVDAQVTLSGPGDEDPTVEVLRFAKYGKEWRLLYFLVDVSDGSEEDPIPLVNASRAIRLSAAKRIKDIEPALRARLAREIKDVDKAIAEIDAFVGVPF